MTAVAEATRSGVKGLPRMTGSYATLNKDDRALGGELADYGCTILRARANGYHADVIGGVGFADAVLQ